MSVFVARSASHAQASVSGRETPLGGIARHKPLERRTPLRGSLQRRQAKVVAQEDMTPSDGEVVPLAGARGANGRFKDLQATVAGATGGVGRAIVRRLVQEGVHVNALVRDGREGANQLGGTGLGSTVHIYQGDVCQFSSLPPALKGSKVLFIATGFRPGPNPLGPFQIDYNGTVNLLAAAQQAKVEHVVLISSIGADDILYPLNLLFGVLFWKKRAEEAIQRSGLRYTIVRPGGLTNETRDGQLPGRIVMAGPNHFGLPPRAAAGSILRSQVADIAVEAVVISEAHNKVVEVIATQEAPLQPLPSLFAAVR